MSASQMQLIALPGLPMVRPGDVLADQILAGVAAAGETLQTGDVLVIAQKIVSKAEGRYADVKEVTPSNRAHELAAEVHKDPRLVELILSEAQSVLRHRPGVLVVVHRLGYVMANAGIDHSNVGPDGDDHVLLLPEDPDGSARALRDRFAADPGVEVGVIVSDSVGRAWRHGTVGMALGVAGLPALQDLRGRNDLYGRPLEVSQVALADELAAAASLLQGQADEGMPVVLIRGAKIDGAPQDAAALLRPAKEDLFR